MGQILRIIVNSFALLCLVLSLLINSRVAYAQQGNPNPGAVWTTEDVCDEVNINHFARKIDVYLNGGPSSRNNPGLPDGNYHVKVTEPQGSLLGITNGAVVVVINGRFAECYNLYELTQFADTTNNGGEYKVWVSQNPNFDNSASKTDNFQVDSVEAEPSPEPTPTGEPTPEPTADPSPSATPQPTIEPTSTPVPTGNPAPTSTPNSGGTGGGGQILAAAASTTYSVSGQVLGATTLANTGSTIDNIFTSIFAVGAILTALGVKRYAGKTR